MRTLSIAAVAALLLGGCAAGTSLSGTVSSAISGGFSADASAVQVSLVERESGSVVASQTVLIEGRDAVGFSLRPDAPAGEYELRARVVNRAGAILYRGEDGIELPAENDLDVTVEPTQAGG